MSKPSRDRCGTPSCKEKPWWNKYWPATNQFYCGKCSNIIKEELVGLDSEVQLFTAWKMVDPPQYEIP